MKLKNILHILKTSPVILQVPYLLKYAYSLVIVSNCYIASLLIILSNIGKIVLEMARYFSLSVFNS